MSLKSIGWWALCVCIGAVTLGSVSGLALGQTTTPSTQPDYQAQEVVLAGKILADSNRLSAAKLALTAAQKAFDADSGQLRYALICDIGSSDADIAAARVALFLQDPSENGERNWAHPELFPKATEAMTVWTAVDVDLINVRDFWFIVDGEGALHVLAAKPLGSDLSKATQWDYSADKDVHVDSADIENQISELHKKIELASTLFPDHAEDFHTWTILFQNERAHYIPTAWDESRMDYVGGETTATPGDTPPVAENGSYYGEISTVNGLPRTHYVNGYYRADGTYVRSYYRSR